MITHIAIAPLLKILSDPIINQTSGSSVQINRSLQLFFRISCFLSVCHQINQHKKNLKFSADPQQNTKSRSSTFNNHVSNIQGYDYKSSMNLASLMLSFVSFLTVHITTLYICDPATLNEAFEIIKIKIYKLLNFYTF